MAALLAVVLLTAGFAPHVHGQDADRALPSYRVEIVIFQYLETTGRPEDPGPPPVPAAPGTTMPGVVIERAAPLPQSLPADARHPQPVFYRPAERQDLLAVAATLGRRAGYRVLAHESWIQPGYPRDEAMPVDLERLGRLRSAGAGMSPLSATVTLWVGRYLHLDVDAQAVAGDRLHRLSESRRMRSGEVHYLDSPSLGAITMIAPLEADAP